MFFRHTGEYEGAVADAEESIKRKPTYMKVRLCIAHLLAGADVICANETELLCSMSVKYLGCSVVFRIRNRKRSGISMETSSGFEVSYTCHCIIE